MRSRRALRVAVLALLVAIVVSAAFWLRRPQSSTALLRQPGVPAISAQPTPEEQTGTSIPETPESSVRPEKCRAQLLVDEPLLMRNAITFTMGHSVGEADLRFPRACKPSRLDSFFALTARGLEALSTDPNAAAVKVPWACDGRDAGFRMTALRDLERGDIPVAIGSNVPQSLQWAPAEQLEASVDCPAPEPGATREFPARYFQLPDTEYRWSIEYWRPGPREYAENDLDAATRIVVLNRVAADGTCELQDRVEAGDFGPLQDNQAEYQRIYGWMRVKDATEEKSWMIFAAGGGESDGVAMVPFDPKTLQLQAAQIHFRRYAGC